MIAYNPRAWFTFIFRLHKSETLSVLGPLLWAVAAYAAIVTYLEEQYLNDPDLISHTQSISIMYTMLGFTLSLLLVFRTNTAYDRWWEGRKLWGSLVNNSRNLSMKLQHLLPIDATRERKAFRDLLPAFAMVLHRHLRKETTRTELFEHADWHPELQQLDSNKHIPNQVATLIYKYINQLYKAETISGEQLLYLNTELQSLTDVCGACERIKNTPIPFSYNVFIKKFIFIYIMTLPIGFVFQLGYWIVPIVVFVFYVLASLELIAEEIEDPFGADANDVPTELIAQNIHKHTLEILHP